MLINDDWFSFGHFVVLFLSGTSVSVHQITNNQRWKPRKPMYHSPANTQIDYGKEKPGKHTTKLALVPSSTSQPTTLLIDLYSHDCKDSSSWNQSTLKTSVRFGPLLVPSVSITLQLKFIYLRNYCTWEQSDNLLIGSPACISDQHVPDWAIDFITSQHSEKCPDIGFPGSCLKDLSAQIKSMWPSLIREDHQEFIKEEWLKRGSCIVRDLSLSSPADLINLVQYLYEGHTKAFHNILNGMEGKIVTASDICQSLSYHGYPLIHRDAQKNIFKGLHIETARRKLSHLDRVTYCSAMKIHIQI